MRGSTWCPTRSRSTGPTPTWRSARRSGCSSPAACWRLWWNRHDVSVPWFARHQKRLFDACGWVGHDDESWVADLLAGPRWQRHVATVEIPWSRRLSVADFGRNIMTKSYVFGLGDRAVELVAAEVDQLLREHPEGVRRRALLDVRRDGPALTDLLCRGSPWSRTSRFTPAPLCPLPRSGGICGQPLGRNPMRLRSMLALCAATATAVSLLGLPAGAAARPPRRGPPRPAPATSARSRRTGSTSSPQGCSGLRSGGGG